MIAKAKECIIFYILKELIACENVACFAERERFGVSELFRALLIRLILLLLLPLLTQNKKLFFTGAD